MTDLPAPRDPDLTGALAKLSGDAITALGWDGTVVGPTTILGRRVVLFVDLLPKAHAHRRATQCGPVIDRDEVSMWSWPEFAQDAPPVAVRLYGVLAPGTHWRTALFGCSAFVGMCPTAVLLPWDAAKVCVPDRSLYEVGVVGTQGGQVDVRREPKFNELRKHGDLDAVQRWVLEVAYAATLTGLETRC